MRILCIVDSLVGGGAQRQLVNVAVGLQGRGHDVHLFAYHRDEWHLPRLLAGRVAYTCAQKRSRFDWRPLRELHRLQRVFRPDVAIAFLRTPSRYAEAVRLLHPRVPLIVSERAGVERAGLAWPDIAAGLGHLLATHVTANSHDYLERLARVLPLRGRSTVIYNGLQPDFFDRGRQNLEARARADSATAATVATATTATATATVATPAAPPSLCVVAARVTRQKGALPLARALAQVRQAYPDLTLDWIGPVDRGSPTFAEVAREIETLGLADCWHWRGPQAGIMDVYGRYDGFVLPSLFEGVANTLCEAMACGLPVVVTDIADNARIVRDGTDGFVCRSDDPAALASALARFLALPAAERLAMGRTAHARAQSLFTMERLVEQWEALCLRLVEQRGAQMRANGHAER